jgi:hypothetical protein
METVSNIFLFYIILSNFMSTLDQAVAMMMSTQIGFACWVTIPCGLVAEHEELILFTVYDQDKLSPK